MRLGRTHWVTCHDPEAIHEAISRLNIPAHGVAKYEWLHENVLNDVNAVIASGACQTSYSYFTTSGVQLSFVEPGTSINEIINYLTDAIREGQG
ncbi:hypothetical protein [Vulcanisaeta thermophila]|uniref:hypothetical protein n=1 Tax=Vulcanisaeta thermophila TaxID=867917 RepID=UPI00192E4ED0|nr:hypothetical protein [Vulcanisaeta thermophila]